MTPPGHCHAQFKFSKSRGGVTWQYAFIASNTQAVCGDKTDALAIGRKRSVRRVRRTALERRCASRRECSQSLPGTATYVRRPSVGYFRDGRIDRQRNRQQWHERTPGQRHRSSLTRSDATRTRWSIRRRFHREKRKLPTFQTSRSAAFHRSPKPRSRLGSATVAR